MINVSTLQKGLEQRARDLAVRDVMAAVQKLPGVGWVSDITVDYYDRGVERKTVTVEMQSVLRSLELALINVVAEKNLARLTEDLLRAFDDVQELRSTVENNT